MNELRRDCPVEWKLGSTLVAYNRRLKMEWDDVSEDARDWLRMLGNFSPTVHTAQRELKGYVHCDEGEDGRIYLEAKDLRKIAAAFVEAADWLDKRADAAMPAVG